MTPQEFKKWQDAHPTIHLSMEQASAFNMFPSLYANDYADKLNKEQTQIALQAEQFIRALYKEGVWAYDSWSKAQRDANKDLLLRDVYNAAQGRSGEGAALEQYSFVRRFLIDYARANGLPDPSFPAPPVYMQDNFMESFSPPTSTPSTLTPKQPEAPTTGFQGETNAIDPNPRLP